MTDRQWAAQAMRYAQSGLAIYALDLATFSVLNWFAPSHFANWTVAGRLVGAAAGFLLHRQYSFAGDKAHSTAQAVWRYILLLAVNAALSVVLLTWAVGHWRFDATWARPVIDVLVIALAFIGSKFWVFRAKVAQP